MFIITYLQVPDEEGEFSTKLDQLNCVGGGVHV